MSQPVSWLRSSLSPRLASQWAAMPNARRPNARRPTARRPTPRRPTARRSCHVLTRFLGVCLTLAAGGGLSTTVSGAALSSAPQAQDSSGVPRRSDLDYRSPRPSTSPSISPLSPLQVTAPNDPRVGESTGLQPRTNAPAPAALGAEAATTVRLPGGETVPPLPTDRGIIQSPGHLNDVAFVDPLQGVAVGNQGLIWRTTDGGRRWATVRCDWPGDLQRIVFANAKQGWIVGGRYLPAAGMHEGVVLRTEDGGVSWRRLTSTLLPRLTELGYDHQEKKLWAFGDPSGQFPSGLFESIDLGTNWSDVPLAVGRGVIGPVAPANYRSVVEDANSQAGRAAAYRPGQWVVSNRFGVWRLMNGRGTKFDRVHANQAGGRANPTFSHSPAGQGSTFAPAFATEHDLAATTLKFRAIRSSQGRWAGLGVDGDLYVADDKADAWERHPAPTEATLAGTAPAVMATAGDNIWVAPQVGKQLWQFNTRSRQWQSQQWPCAMTCQSLFFLDDQTGWAVGAQGYVLHTQDGGKSWHWLHRSQPGLGVLLLAADAADVPPELLAHLSVNHGVNVGILCGDSRLPWGVTAQAYWQNEATLLVADPTLFDTQHPTGADPGQKDAAAGQASPAADYRAQQVVRIQNYLSAWQPRVVLVCPPLAAAGRRHALENDSNGRTTQRQIDQGLWLETIQRQRASGSLGQVAVMAMINDGGGDTSISAQGLAANVGQLLEDVAWPSRQLLAAWEPGRQFSEHTSPGVGPFGPTNIPSVKNRHDRGSRPTTWSVRTLMQWELDELSWFHAKNAARGTLGHSVAVRPVRSRQAATNLDSIHQMTRKSSWMYQLQAVTTDSPMLRREWTQAVGIGLMKLPPSLQTQWLFDLAQLCEARGDGRKALLARWEILQAGLDRPEALAVLLPTLVGLISDEGQWPNRLEAKIARQQRFAELQRQFASEAADGQLTEAERRANALRRFGVEPEMESRVPAEIIERILLLDTVQREAVREGRMEPDPEVARRAAVPQARVVTDAQTQQQQSRFGQVQRQTTTLTWDTPLSADGLSTAAGPVLNPAALTVVDASAEQRLEWAASIIRQADSIWPGLSGLPEWWQLKARVKQRQRDVAQTEIAWKRLEEMAAEPLLHGSIYSSYLSHAHVARERALSIAWAEVGPSASLAEVGRRLATQVASSGDAAALSVPGLNAGEAGNPSTLAVLPVTWTLERPLLDGQLHEPFWESDTHPIVRLAQDEQYLYLALILPNTADNTTGPPLWPTTPRDPAVPGGTAGAPARAAAPGSAANVARDQVDPQQLWTLTLDTDGDRLSSFVIQLDGNGGVAERQGTQWSWNPTLFVASNPGTSQRVIEIAIDLDDLSTERIGQPWQLQLLNPNREVLVDAWLQLEDLFAQ